jgi:hypothetical protein
MSSNINDFFQSFKNELARPSRFDVVITQPSGFLGAYFNTTRQLTYRCETAELPGKTYVTHDQKIYGVVQKFPYQHSYNDMNLTFVVSDDMAEKTFFDGWMDLISPTNTYNFEYKDNYKTTVIITQYNQQDKPTKKIELLEAYPITVNQLDLDWSTDGHHKLTVVMAYTYWKEMAITS